MDAVTEAFGILGVRGSGKSTTAKVIVEELTKSGQQSVIIDPLGVWWGLRSSADGKSEGLPFLVLGGEHADIPLTPQSGELIADLVIRDRVPVVVDLSLMRKGEQRQWMLAFAERLYHANREALHLVVDEADLFAPQKPLKGSERLLGAMEDLVRRGRSKGIGVSAITQRPASIHKDVLSQVSTLVVHRLVGPQDRKAIDSWVEANGTREQRDELMASVASLPTGTAWFWSPMWLSIFQKVGVRLPDTFDSSATPKAGEKRVEPKAFAQVDLVALREQMSEVVEEAERTDPRALQRQLTAAKRELDKVKNDLEAARNREPRSTDANPAEVIEKIVTQSVAVLPEGLRDVSIATAEGLEASAVALREAADVQVRAMKSAADGFDNQAEIIRRAVTEAERAEGKPIAASATLGAPAPAIRPAPSPARTPATRSLHAPTPVQAEPVSSNGSADGAALPGGAKRMLAAMVRTYPRRLSLSQLLTMSGMKKSGTSSSYLKTLQARGLLVRGADGLFDISQGGFDEAGEAVPNAPQSAADVRDMWRSTLPGGGQRMFDVLVGMYPSGISRDELAEAAGMTVSGTFSGYLKTLKDNNMVVVNGSSVSASADMFDLVDA